MPTKNKTKSKPVTRSFSFKEDNWDALAYLDKQSNKSDFVCMLIREYMARKEEEEKMIKQMRQLIVKSELEDGE